LYVLSTGVRFTGGSVLETHTYRMESGDYRVEQEILVEPEMQAVEGAVKALCAACLSDVTAAYLAHDEDAEPLPA
jgi:hypothetical protein